MRPRRRILLEWLVTSHSQGQWARGALDSEPGTCPLRLAGGWLGGCGENIPAAVEAGVTAKPGQAQLTAATPSPGWLLAGLSFLE